MAQREEAAMTELALDRLASPKVGKRRQVVLTLVTIALLLATPTSAWATPTIEGGVNYDLQCFAAGVPMPPDFLPKVGTNYWNYNGTITSAQSFTGSLSGTRYIYYYISPGGQAPFDGQGGTQPPGLCMANSDGGSNEINILCQGSNGKTCFWRWPNFPPIGAFQSGPLPINAGAINISPRISSRNHQDFLAPGDFGPGDTGTDCNVNNGAGCTRIFSGGNEHGFNDGTVAFNSTTSVPIACTDCHAGENMIINHPGTATDIRYYLTTNAQYQDYFPTLGGAANWPDPLVPTYNALNVCGYGSGTGTGNAAGGSSTGPCNYFPPFNPGPSDYSTSSSSWPNLEGSSCFVCHAAPSGNATNYAGRFPFISAALGPGDITYNSSTVTEDYTNTVFYPSVDRTMPASCTNSTCTSATSCTNSTCDGAMPANEPHPQSAYGNSEPFTLEVLNDDGQWLADAQGPNYGNSSGGSGYQWPQTTTSRPPNGSTPGQYLSVYGHWLNYNTSYTQLESTSTHFCWVSGIEVVTVYGSQPSPAETMSLQVTPNGYWQLQGSYNTGGTINAQCAPWAAFFGSQITGYNARGWTPVAAMNSYVTRSYGPKAPSRISASSPVAISGSSTTSVCFISGFDGAFVTNYDTTQAAATLWWPGEQSPNSYGAIGGNGTQWYVQQSNSSTQNFYDTWITCIDLGLLDPGNFNASKPPPYTNSSTGDMFADWQSGSGASGSRVTYYASSPEYGERVTASMFGNACFFTQIVATGDQSGCYGNVATSELDNSYFYYDGGYYYCGEICTQQYDGPYSLFGAYVINESSPFTGETCNTDVIWLAQSCLNVIP
jgi:hypothetical protein